MERKITKDTLKKATEHLFYETEMFYQTLVFLTQPRSRIEVNILLDSFAIHARNLFYFFYPKQKSKKSPKIKYKKDDMFAFDYVKKLGDFRHAKIKKKDLRFLLRKVDKQVAHLTYARNRYNIKTKPWVFIDIGKKMSKTLIAFYDSLPDSFKNWDNFKALKTIINSLQTI